MTSIYTKLHEAVERSKTYVETSNEDGFECRFEAVNANTLLAELKKLEESEPKSSCCGAPLKLNEDGNGWTGCSNCDLPPLTKEEKDYYEGLRPKEEWWKIHATQIWFEDVDEDQFEANVGKLVAEARKKALEEVEEMISAYAQQAVQGHEAVAFNALKAELDEMMK